VRDIKTDKLQLCRVKEKSLRRQRREKEKEVGKRRAEGVCTVSSYKRVIVMISAKE